MSNDNARFWLVKASLLITTLTFCFFIIAPFCGYPLRFDQAIILIEITLPVFLGYIGAASQFVFRKQTKETTMLSQNPIMNLLIKGPIYVFSIIVSVIVIVFGLSNSEGAPVGQGITIDALTALIATALGILSVSTNVAIFYLFSIET